MHTRIVIGVTGGIAAYKIPHLVRLLRKKGAEIKVVLTSHAVPLVGVEALRTVSGNPVYLDGALEYDMDHIRLTQWADCFLVAPGTANTIAKISHGIADNLLTSLACAFSPLKTIIAPAMNTAMWENPATQDNVARLLLRGYTMLPVGHGELACGDEGAGRMAEIEAIVEALFDWRRRKQPLAGRKVLISSGPTEEPIDSVRVITNRSSGKMGAALAQEALRLGADVTVVSGPAVTPLPKGIEVVAIRTAAEMDAAMQRFFSTADICIMAAAVSDYRPHTVAAGKIKRAEQATLTIDLVANPDILAGLGCRKGPRQLLAGFALESGGSEDLAREKLDRKQCDFMVYNRVATSLGTDTTEMVILDRRGGCRRTGSVSKEIAARELFACIIESAGPVNG